jgi:hypothetical protein
VNFQYGSWGKKSMCVAAKGRLQGRAVTLLLLCGWVFFFLLCINAAKISCLIVSLFFPRLACNGCGMKRKDFIALSYPAAK